jgi:hypothetical protein
MKLTIIALLLSLSATATEKCKGVTKSGKPCQSTFVTKQGYCNAHNPSSAHCPYVKPDGTNCKMVSDGLCRFHKK